MTELMQEIWINQFASLAPEVPGWWQDPNPPAYTGRPMPIIDECFKDMDQRKVASDWLRDGCFNLDPDMVFFQVETEAYRADKKVHAAKVHMSLLVSWRWAYARAMFEKGFT